MELYICSAYGNCPKNDCKHIHRHEYDYTCKDRCDKIISMHPDLRPYCKSSISQNPLSDKEKHNA